MTGDTPSATNSEIRLAKLGSQMAYLSRNMTGGYDYLKGTAEADKSQRYQEQALAKVAEAQQPTLGGNWQNQYVTTGGSADAASLGVASRSAADQAISKQVTALASADLGQQGNASSAEYKIGLDIMAENYAKEQAKQQMNANIMNAIGTVGGYAASKYSAAKPGTDVSKSVDSTLASGWDSFVSDNTFDPNNPMGNVKAYNTLGDIGYNYNQYQYV